MRFEVVNAVALSKSLYNKPCFEAIHKALGICLGFEDEAAVLEKMTTDRVDIFGTLLI